VHVSLVYRQGDRVLSYFRPVKVLRLVARNTVEEVIMHRARGKLKLTEAVMDTGDCESSSGSALSVALTSSGGQQVSIIGFAPRYLAELLTDCTPVRAFRSSDSPILAVPPFK